METILEAQVWCSVRKGDKKSDSLITNAHYLRQMVPGFVKRGVSEEEARSARDFVIGTRVVFNSKRENCAFTLLGRIENTAVSDTWIVTEKGF